MNLIVVNGNAMFSISILGINAGKNYRRIHGSQDQTFVEVLHVTAYSCMRSTKSIIIQSVKNNL